MRRLAHAQVLPKPLVSRYYYQIHIQPRPTTPLRYTHSAATGSLERAQYSILPLSTLRRTVNTLLICAQIIATTFAPGNAAVSPTLWYCLSRPIHSSVPVEIANSPPLLLHPGQIYGVHRESPSRPVLHAASHSCALELGNSRLSYTATKETTSQTDSTPE